MQEAAKEEGRTIWRPLTGEAMAGNIRKTLLRTAKILELPPEQLKAIEPDIARCECLEHEHLARFRTSLARVQDLLHDGSNDAAMFDCVRDLHANHERFLYYQSIYSAPRWSVLMRTASPITFGRWIADVRKRYYSKNRMRRQLKRVRKYTTP
jgi:hypothetical protein